MDRSRNTRLSNSCPNASGSVTRALGVVPMAATARDGSTRWRLGARLRCEGLPFACDVSLEGAVRHIRTGVACESEDQSGDLAWVSADAVESDDVSACNRRQVVAVRVLYVREVTLHVAWPPATAEELGDPGEVHLWAGVAGRVTVEQRLE